ncbi:MBOAT family protein [Necator americanus]|uniref:MBOAT family protein n=1 Tax=Necator americanus TaxID=51031 RepID=W2SXZ1_NECAM|nr:MBOAT family protein [Necator americanus]ETN74505.1 MBOAT family protein [Necator americanus]
MGVSTGRFVPAPLGRCERALCWIVWLFHSAAAFFIAANVSQGKLRPWIGHWLSNSSYVTGMKVDLSDTEWLHFRNTISHMLLDYALHSVMFFLIIRHVSTKWVKLALFAAGLLLQIHMTSPTCVIVLIVFATAVTGLSLLTRNIAVPWILCISFVLKASDIVPFTMANHTYYREFNIYLYGAIKILNFSLYMCKNKEKKYAEVWEDHLVYLSYLPYSMTLIVLFDDFIVQLQRRLPHKEDCGSFVDLRSAAFFGVRLLLWYFVFEFILHFIYVHSLFNSPFTMVQHLGNYEKCAVAYVIGQLFHVKYVVLFGVPAFFARIDGMQPPPPPICISRVSRYSRMWRHFDAGLYQFLKNQVYIPLLKVEIPTALVIIRNLCTLAAVFGVVLAWHGTRSHYVCWVLLSATELIMERIGKLIWDTTSFQELRKSIGELNTRRAIAVAMISTVIPGIFGVFFFLGSEGTGSIILEHILLDGMKDVLKGNVFPNNSGFVFLHMIALGYFFNNVCLEFEQAAKPEKDEDTKQE